MLAITALLATLASTALCQTTIKNLQSLTSQASDLLSNANSITTVNSLSFIAGTGPVPATIEGLLAIAASTNAYAKQITSVVDDKDEEGNIYTTYIGFTHTYTEALDALIGKANLFTLFPAIAKPIVDALNGNKAALDSLGYQLVNNVEEYRLLISLEAARVDDTVASAVKKYSTLLVV